MATALAPKADHARQTDERGVAPSEHDAPPGLLTFAVQQLLGVSGLRLGIARRLEDQHDAAIFVVAQNPRTGAACARLAVPYRVHRGRRMTIVSLLMGTRHQQQELTWDFEGKPGRGTKAVGYFAATEECVLLQRVNAQDYRSSKIDLAKVLYEGDTKSDLMLNPKDVLFVPKTGIAKADVWVDQHVIKLIPIRFGYGF